jgi:hypothetical protein
VKICTKCGKQNDSEFKFCSKCREYSRVWTKEKRNRIVTDENTVCSSCFKSKPADKYKTCESCRERRRKYCRENPEKIKEYSLKHNKGYYEKNKERIIEQHRVYTKLNTERLKRKQHMYYEANRERMIAESCENYWNNREKKLEYLKDYRKENAAKIRINNLNRYALMKGNGGKLPKDVEVILFEQQNGLCYLCSDPLYAKLNDPPQLEHKLPISRGGKNNIANVGLAHTSCNSKKRAKTPDEYFEYLANHTSSRRFR